MSDVPEESNIIVKESLESYDLILSEDTKQRQLENTIFEEIGSSIRSRGYMKKREGKQILSWRRPTRRNLFEENQKERIEKVTRISFNTNDEELKIYILTILKGVALNNASKILAVVYPDKYATFNTINWEILKQWGYLKTDYNNDPRSWVKFLDAIYEFSQKYDISIRDADKVLLATYLKYELETIVTKFASLDKYF